jgi:hypothetical protein
MSGMIFLSAGNQKSYTSKLLVAVCSACVVAMKVSPLHDVGAVATASNALKSSALTAYKKSYQKRGARDAHENVFQSLTEIASTHPSKVLYPGCHRHITASLVFPHVDYVDCDSKVKNVYEDAAVREWILSETKKSPEWTFTCASFASPLPAGRFSLENYDLVISLSAGLIAKPCAGYLKEGGFLLVNDSHGDASAAYVLQNEAARFQLTATWDTDTSSWSTTDLEDYFVTTKGEVLSEAQAGEVSRIGSKSKRSFQFRQESPFYLFQKIPKATVDSKQESTEESKQENTESSGRKRQRETRT